MSVKTLTVTIDNAGNPEPITVTSPCSRLRIAEDDQAGTTDLILHAPTMGSPGVTIPGGKVIEFLAGEKNLFQVGQVVGYLETVTGSISCQQIED